MSSAFWRRSSRGECSQRHRFSHAVELWFGYTGNFQHGLSRLCVSDCQSSEEGEPGFECVRKSLKAAAELFKARGMRAVFTVYPMPAVVGSGYPFRALHQKMIALAEEDGFAALDLAPAFEHVTPAQVRLNELDGHPNSFANGLAAKAIAKELNHLGLLKTGTLLPGKQK